MGRFRMHRTWSCTDQAVVSDTCMASLYEIGWLILIDQSDTSRKSVEIILFFLHHVPRRPSFYFHQVLQMSNWARNSLTSFNADILSTNPLEHVSGDCLRDYYVLLQTLSPLHAWSEVLDTLP